MAKRAFDLVLAGVGVLFLTPLLACIAVAVRLSSPGPIFYRGVRTGRHGKLFRILKFRTMVDRADQLGGPSTGKDDPRVTTVGKFLRRHKLDELPQLFNVLLGDMSLVGPRPEVPKYTSWYNGAEREILTVRPGITDYSSLQFVHLDEALGNVEPDRIYEEQILPVKNRLRIQYVREQSFWNDLLILGQTLFRVLLSKRHPTVRGAGR